MRLWLFMFVYASVYWTCKALLFGHKSCQVSIWFVFYCKGSIFWKMHDHCFGWGVLVEIAMSSTGLQLPCSEVGHKLSCGGNCIRNCQKDSWDDPLTSLDLSFLTCKMGEHNFSVLLGLLSSSRESSLPSVLSRFLKRVNIMPFHGAWNAVLLQHAGESQREGNSPVSALNSCVAVCSALSNEHTFSTDVPVPLGPGWSVLIARTCTLG